MSKNKDFSANIPAIQQITKGPKHHWFGYYDKLQFDATGRYVLGMEVDLNGRSPAPDDVIKVGMIDLQGDNRWIELGETRAWCWQQGCMLQWRPGHPNEVLWNDREGEQFVCHILDVKTGRKRTVQFPVYSIHPSGNIAVFPDFRRINLMRPGYGYAGIPDPNEDILAPVNAGIWRVDLESGKIKLIISFADIYSIPYRHGDFGDGRHWFNHLLFSPDGTRFIFLHRWRVGKDGWNTRMFTASAEGKDLHIVDDYGEMSHFIWRDPKHILGWAKRPVEGPRFYSVSFLFFRSFAVTTRTKHDWRFFLYEDQTKNVEIVGEGVMTENGHCSYLPGNEWILNDTYPDKERKQHLYLYHIRTGKKVPLGDFYAPVEYCGEWRCDLHPRFSPDGRIVCVDSAHDGIRQIYLMDISEAIK
jgi:hypothetical protein